MRIQLLNSCCYLSPSVRGVARFDEPRKRESAVHHGPAVFQTGRLNSRLTNGIFVSTPSCRSNVSAVQPPPVRWNSKRYSAFSRVGTVTVTVHVAISVALTSEYESKTL